MESETLDLAIFVQSDSFGGTERHTVELLNHIDEKGLKSAFLYCGEGFNGRVPENFSSLKSLKVVSKVRKLTIKDIMIWRKVFKGSNAKKALLIKPSYFSLDLKFLFLLRLHYKDLVVIEHSLPAKRLHLPKIGFIPKFGWWRLKDETFRFLFAKLIDKVIVVSEIAKTESINHTYYKDINVCGNGINTKAWVRDKNKGADFRSENGIDKDLYIFGCVGNLFKVKSFDIAIQALSLLSEKYRRQCGLCVVGVGLEYENLKALVEDLNLENVFFLGKKSDMVAAYSAMQTLLITSISESASLALLEATACDCNILSSDVGICKEVISEMQNGIVIDSHDPKVWANKIEAHLEQNKNDGDPLRFSRKSKFEEKYDIKKRMSSLLETIMMND